MIFHQFTSALFFYARGPDTRRYLNSRLTNDIKNLKESSACIAAALTPQGRTQGLFLVVARANDEFLLICNGGASSDVLSALKKYIVADRVEISEVTGEYALVHCSEEEGATQFSAFPKLSDRTVSPLVVFIEDELIFVGNKRLSQVGFDILVPTSKLQSTKEKLLASGAIEVFEEEYRIKRFKAGLPSFPEEINEKFIISANDLANIISFNKGCYVGQEVVEKVDAFGKLANVLKHAVFSGQLPAQSSPVITENKSGTERNIGKIVSSCYERESDKTYAFVEIKNDEHLLSQNFQAGGRTGHIIS